MSILARLRRHISPGGHSYNSSDVAWQKKNIFLCVIDAALYGCKFILFLVTVHSLVTYVFIQLVFTLQEIIVTLRKYEHTETFKSH